MTGPIRTVALQEYWTTVRRREFLLVTFGLPLLLLGVGGLAAAGTFAAADALLKSAPGQIGVVDPTGKLFAVSKEARSETEGVRVYPTKEAGLEMVRQGRLRSLLILDADYMRTGKVAIYHHRTSLLAQETGAPIRALLVQALLRNSRIDSQVRERILAPTGRDGPTVLSPGNAPGTWTERNAARDAAKFAVPYTFTILLSTALFVSASYLLRGIAEEKENRVIEVILSSIRADDLLLGKLLGLAAAGLTQVLAWFLLGALPLLFRFQTIIQLSGNALPGSLVFFLLGYGFYATLLAGIGSTVQNFRESQQVTGIVSMGVFLPLVFFPVLIEMPNGLVARILSFIPFTSPTVMLLRLTATSVPAGDIAGAALLMGISIWAAHRFSVKLFRYGLLVYGKKLGFGEMLRVLRAA